MVEGALGVVARGRQDSGPSSIPSHGPPTETTYGRFPSESRAESTFPPHDPILTKSTLWGTQLSVSNR